MDSIIFGGLSLYKLKTKRASFEVYPAGGGQWLGLSLASPADGAEISVISGHKAPDPFFASGSFLMFPWVNRLEPNPWAREPFYPSTHWLTDGNGIPLHGLYHNLPRILKDETIGENQSTVSFSFVLPTEWEGTTLHKINVTERFVLTDSELKVQYILKNESDSNFSFALGIHPYFRLGDESSIDDLYLFGSGFHEVKLGDYLLPEKILSEEIRFEEEVKLEGRSYDSLYQARLTDGTDSYFGFFSMNRKDRVLVGGGNFYQIFTPSDRKSIAIEPMTATGNFLHFCNDFSHKLPPGEVKKIEFFIRLESF
ncbi:aldose 1-epimerase [Leptospira ognonensis]|uniref:aldose 1-epimerase n=1 Tax=Leptospira ognonensis TaxID=2484945 RepID=UPI001FE28E3E|nr:aldose 1-epimerase [Leptospira ognonensis]